MTLVLRNHCHGTDPGQVSRTILANVDVFQVSKLLFLKLNAQYNFKGIAKISPTATVDANVHIFHKSLTNVGGNRGLKLSVQLADRLTNSVDQSSITQIQLV